MEFAGLDITNIILWLALGVVTGIAIHIVDRERVRGGLLGTVFTGLVGAVLGGFLANVLLGISLDGFNLQSVLIALGGALILVALQRVAFRDTGHIRTSITHREEGEN